MRWVMQHAGACCVVLEFARGEGTHSRRRRPQGIDAIAGETPTTAREGKIAGRSGDLPRRKKVTGGSGDPPRR